MWDKIVKNLSKQLSRPQYESWIKPIKCLRIDDRNIYLAVPNNYFKTWVTKNLSGPISDAIKDETGQKLDLVIEIDSTLEGQKPDSEDVDLEKKEETDQTAYTDRQVDNLKTFNKNLNLKYTFDSFVVGPNNKFAYSMASAVADKPGKLHNPLFLYGGVGLGKTHLMQAIGHHVFSKYPGRQILYTTTEKFTNELIESLRRNTSSQFRSRYREIDLLLIDDVQFLEGKERTQEEFFYTFNTLHEAGKQIVLSSDRPPKQIPNLTERLVSRFEWGITVDIQIPDIETRIAILRNKAQADRMDIPNDVLELIATAYQHNIRELEGALNRVVAYVGVTGCPMNVESVRGLIESTSRAKMVTPDHIIEVVAEYYKVTAADIKGSSRMKAIAQARQIAIYLIREVTSLSFPNIGDVFSKKHSTIIYAYDKIKEEILANPSLATMISEIKSRVT